MYIHNSGWGLELLCQGNFSWSVEVRCVTGTASALLQSGIRRHFIWRIISPIEFR